MIYRPVLISSIVASLAGTAVLCSACSPTIEQQGFNAELVDFKKIQVGVHTKDQVLEVLGSPSTISAFKDNKWYYISKTVSAKAFLRPTTLDQKVVVISFNASSVVSNIEELTGDDATAIKPVERATKSSGYETGVLREVFGGFGRMGSKKPTR